MSPSSLYRGAATALIVGAVLTVTGFVLHPVAEPAAMTAPLWLLSHAFLWVGALAAIAGLAGLYLRQREHIATLGVVEVVLAALGLAALSGAYYYEAVIVPALAAQAPTLMQTFPAGAPWRAYLGVVAASGTLVAVGFVLFGATMYRAAALPRWAITCACLGAAAAGVQFLLPRPTAIAAFATLGVGLTGLGRGLWTSVLPARPGPPRTDPAAEGS
jgi:hypothetical protein